MDIEFKKAYKPKRKFFFLRTTSAIGYEGFLEENGRTWFSRFSGIHRAIDSMGLFYLPESMTKEGTSRLCCGLEIGVTDLDDRPEGCDMEILPGFDLVEITGYSNEFIDDIPKLMSNAYAYAKLYIENERIHIVSNEKLPYVCYMQDDRTLRVEIPVWSKKTKTEELLTIDSMPKRYLYELAYRDQETGFYNWAWLKSKLEQCKYIGVDKFVFAKFDIKNFKLVNNIFGKEVAKGLFTSICDTLSKQSWIINCAKCEGDNFAMIMEDMDEVELTEKLYKLFEELGSLPSNRKYKIFYRCGVVFFDGTEEVSGMSIEDMAQMAQTQGMKSNVTQVIFYTDEMKHNYIMAQKYKVELPNAMENEDLMVYLQPKYNPQTDTLTGAEALIRWFYKGEDLLSPKYFVPQFEADGTIDVIDRFVLRQVCKKFAQWKEQGLPLYPISCNLSRHQIGRPDLIFILCDIVDEYGVDHGLIDFEITESAEFTDTNYLINVLNDIKARGFKISMDDFGTGYSSLSLLKNMPLDIIKIDKSFIDGIAVGELNNKDMLMAKDILTISNHLGIKSLAEGVESFEQKEYLKDWGCNYIQGYYYSKPIPIVDYEYLLKKAALDNYNK